MRVLMSVFEVSSNVRLSEDGSSEDRRADITLQVSIAGSVPIRHYIAIPYSDKDKYVVGQKFELDFGQP